MLACLAFGAPAHVARAEIEAEFVVRLLKFAEWPVEVLPVRTSPLRLCLYAPAEMQARFTDALAAYVGGHPLALVWAPAPGTLNECHAVFVDEADRAQLAGVIAITRGHPVLTISDANGALQDGVMIEMYPAAGAGLRFEVSAERARSAGLRLNSQLLRVARSRVSGADNVTGSVR